MAATETHVISETRSFPAISSDSTEDEPEDAENPLYSPATLSTPPSSPAEIMGKIKRGDTVNRLNDVAVGVQNLAVDTEAKEESKEELSPAADSEPLPQLETPEAANVEIPEGKRKGKKGKAKGKTVSAERDAVAGIIPEPETVSGRPVPVVDSAASDSDVRDVAANTQNIRASDAKSEREISNSSEIPAVPLLIAPDGNEADRIDGGLVSHPLMDMEEVRVQEVNVEKRETGTVEKVASGDGFADLKRRESKEPSPSEDGKKRKKKVSFCGDSDDAVVTRFVDAPDPWRLAEDSSVQNVLEAYAHMCLQNKVQPLPKVLESIKRNPGNRQRSGVFDLSGEMLDTTTVDTLESVFMRLCFEELNLNGCLTDDELAVSIMDMLEYYQFADKLVMSNNKKLQFRGWLALAKILKKCCIYYLDVRGCLFQDQYASLLTRALRCGSNIVTLHLESCNLTGRPAFLLISALQFSETVQELFMGDNKLTPTDMIHVGNALKHGWRIRVLDLRNNCIGDSGACHLIDNMEDDGMNGHWGLRSLVLWNNGLTSHISKSLSRTLSRTRTLETLNLGMNELTDETLFHIKEAMMKNRSLRRLGLQSCRISNEGCIALAEFVAEHPRFLRLDLRYNMDIKAGGWLALAHAAKLSPGLIRLDVTYDGATIKDAKHMETIRDALKVIQMACLNNQETFEQATAPQPLEDIAEVSEVAAETPVQDLPEPFDESSSTDVPPTTPSVDLEDPRCDFPTFNGSFAQDPDPDTHSPSHDIDMPKKKCRPATQRRISITSVTSTGPVSVCDRLQEELFPVRAAPPPVPSSTPVVKGRFQISLVKASEKLLQSVQNVLSPTGNPGLPGDRTPEREERAGTPTGEGKGKFLTNFRNSFRRNSKDLDSVTTGNVVKFEKEAEAKRNAEEQADAAGNSEKATLADSFQADPYFHLTM